MDDANGEAHIGEDVGETDDHRGDGDQAEISLAEETGQDEQFQHLHQSIVRCGRSVPLCSVYRLVSQPHITSVFCTSSFAGRQIEPAIEAKKR